MKSGTRKILFLLIFLCLVGIAGFGLILVAIKMQVKAVSDNLAAVESQRASSEADHALRSLLTDIDPAIKRLSSRAVAKDGDVAFIEMIENLAKNTNLTPHVNSIDNPTSDIVGYQWMQISISTKGSWAANYKFLSLLENLPYRSQVNTTLFSSSQSGLADPANTTGGKVVSTPPTTVWEGDFNFQVLQKI